jgi:putative transposase
MRQGHPERLEAFDYIGFHRYFLTFCTFERRGVFVNNDAVGLVRTQLSRASSESQFSVSAYCFMPDHLHLLVEGLSESSDGRRLVALFKQLSGFHYQHMFRARLWQRYGYERVLRGDEDTRAISNTFWRIPFAPDFAAARGSTSSRVPTDFLSKRSWSGRSRGARLDRKFRLKPEPTTPGAYF